MGFHDYISESEAASLAGVSATTLNRFVEAGYLRVETDSDGLKMFSKSELGDIFGLRNREATPLEKSIETSTLESEASQPVQTEETSATSETEQGFWADTVDPENKPEETDLASYNQTGETVKLTEEITVGSTYQPAQRTASLNQEFNALKMEIHKLQNISNMQERILDMREKEIADLKEERKWLKNRIERFEEKNDRDQLLILSETQMIRQLVHMQQNNRSTLRSALEWFGLVTPKPAKEVNLPARIVEHK